MCSRGDEGKGEAREGGVVVVLGPVEKEEKDLAFAVVAHASEALAGGRVVFVVGAAAGIIVLNVALELLLLLLLLAWLSCRLPTPPTTKRCTAFIFCSCVCLGQKKNISMMVKNNNNAFPKKASFSYPFSSPSSL